MMIGLTGMKTKFKHMKIKYPFQARFWINVGVIITTKKFQSQFAEIPIAWLLWKKIGGLMNIFQYRNRHQKIDGVLYSGV